MLTITLDKYRKTQQLLEHAERRSDESVSVIHHKTVVASGINNSLRRRSYSVTRESSSRQKTA